MSLASNFEFGDTIAERELNFKTDKGEQILIIKLGRPRPDSKPGGDWECPIQIGKEMKMAYGIDSYQALSIALQLISIELRYLKDAENLNLKWLGMDDLGFESIRE